MSAATAETAILTEEMMARDVADTVRHNDGMSSSGPKALTGEALAEALRARYRQQGLEVSDSALQTGIAAAADWRYAYVPPKPQLAVTLARLYVVRQHWLPATVAVTLMFVIGFGGFFLVYRPWRDAQLQQAQLDLAQGRPAEMDELYQTIFDETKVQQAANDALDIRQRGKDAAAHDDRAGAQAAIDDLTQIRDTLRQDYQLKVVDRADVKWGFWTFPKSNAEATNYYLVVQPLDAQGHPESLPIRSEDTGKLETVSLWAERVPEEVYRAVEADKRDDGVIEQSLIAVKDFGFLEPDYLVGTLGGRLTRW